MSLSSRLPPSGCCFHLLVAKTRMIFAMTPTLSITVLLSRFGCKEFALDGLKVWHLLSPSDVDCPALAGISGQSMLLSKAVNGLRSSFQELVPVVGLVNSRQDSSDFMNIHCLLV